MTEGKPQAPLALSMFLLCTWASCAIIAVAEAPGDTATNALQARTKLQALVFPVAQTIDFSEQQFNPMLSRPIASHGQVWLEADGAMVMQVESPRAELRRLRGDALSLSPGATDAAAPPSPAVGTRQLRLRPERSAHMILLAAGALLRGDIDWLSQHFTLSLSSSLTDADQRASWEVLLVPSRASLREQLPWIALHGHEQQLQRLRADRGAKGWQQLDFKPRQP